MPVKKKKRDYRTGTIQTWEAKQHFDEYYKDNTKSLIGEFRGKIFDMLYQKKEKFTIKCNNTKKNKIIKNSKNEDETLKPGHCEKGSIKYLLPKGPKTFDIDGIDSFPEGSKFKVPGDSKNKTYTAKGYTLIKQIDKITNVVAKGAVENKKNKKVYGPRYSKDGELYSSKFRKAYKSRMKRLKKKGGLIDDTTSELLHLVGFRWKSPKGSKKKSVSKKRKLKRRVPVRPKASVLIYSGFAQSEDMEELRETGVSLNRTYTLIKGPDGALILKHNKTVINKSSDEYESMNDFIKAIKLKVKKKVVDNINTIKYMRIKLKKVDEDDEDDDEEDEYEFILNIRSGHLLSIGKPHYKIFKNLTEFYTSKKSDYEIVSSKSVDL